MFGVCYWTETAGILTTKIKITPKELFLNSSTTPSINLLSLLPLVGGIKGRLKHLRTLTKTGFKRSESTDIPADTLAQGIQEIKDTPLLVFHKQLSESTDIEKCSKSLVYVRHINDDDVKDEFLFGKLLEKTATPCDIVDAAGSLLKDRKISWFAQTACQLC